MVEQEKILSEEEINTIAEESQKLIDREEKASGNVSDQVKNYEKYDFSQSAGAAQLLQDYLVVISNLHQQLVRDFADSVSGLIRSVTEVEFTGANQMTFGEFCDGLDDPSCFCKLAMENTDGMMVESTLVIGKITSCKVKELCHNQMVVCILANFKIT